MAPIIITIEGNIGSGKSTLLQNLQEKNKNKNYIFVKEPVDLWEKVQDENGKTILENFYADSTKYSFAFQMMAFTTRMSVLRKAIQLNPNAEVIICERSIDADKNVFAQMLYDDKLMSKMEHQIYTDLAKEYIDENPLDGIVYFYTTSDKCQDRIKIRSRTGESNIEESYLSKCEKYHNNWLLKEDGGPTWEGILTGTDEPTILNLQGNHDTVYNLNDPDNQGYKWLMYIEELISYLTESNNLQHFKMDEDKSIKSINSMESIVSTDDINELNNCVFYKRTSDLETCCDNIDQKRFH
tara:strand:- start:916 stop:1806 length:891 start_codon:yes stop_codon:yes gene_type:complete